MKNLNDFLAQYSLDKEEALKRISYLLSTKKAITVHSGRDFHQDETLGAATLLIFAEKILGIPSSEITIIRTRDPQEFCGIVIDVGGGFLDHHMEPENRAIREDGVKYAAAGLVWAIIGKTLVPERFIKNVDKKIFKPSDMTDNGEGKSSTNFAELMSPIDEEDDLMELFMETVEHYKRCLERLIKYYNKVSEKGDITPYINEGSKTGIMILPKHIPWEEQAIEADIKFVIWKNEDASSEDKYLLRVVPVEEGSFIAKIPLPVTYKGVPILGKRADFFSTCGVEEISGLNFVHSERFFACAKDIESLLSLAKSVL